MRFCEILAKRACFIKVLITNVNSFFCFHYFLSLALVFMLMRNFATFAVQTNT